MVKEYLTLNQNVPLSIGTYYAPEQELGVTAPTGISLGA